jgi:DNA-binding response OmpR family regulator
MNTKRSKGYVLIVDDEPVWRNFSWLTLTDEGYRVETASELGEALNLLQEDGYDIVFVSSDLLGQDEIELLVKLIARRKDKRLVVMSEPSLSRTLSLAESRKALKLGADEWVRKPLGKRSLLDLVDAFFPSRPMAAEQSQR